MGWRTVAAYALLAATATLCNGQTITDPSSVTPGGSLYVTTNPDIYGNNVTQRAARHLPQGSDKIWVDIEIPLGSGTLANFYVYIADFVSDDDVCMRLQIWQPVSASASTNRHRLICEIRVCFNSTQPAGGALYTFPVTDICIVRDGDHVGWTNESPLSPVTFRYIENHKTIFKTLENATSFPVLNDPVDFNPIFLPSIFSIAAEVQSDGAGQTGATGATGPGGPSGNAGATATGSSQTSGTMTTGPMELSTSPLAVSPSTSEPFTEPPAEPPGVIENHTSIIVGITVAATIGLIVMVTSVAICIFCWIKKRRGQSLNILGLNLLN